MANREGEINTNSYESNAKGHVSGHKDRRLKPFYGDLVCAVAFTAVVPVDGGKSVATCQDDHGICHIAVLSVTFCALYGGLNWLAYLKHSNFFSFCAFLSGLWLCAFNNICGWPYPDECVITPQFQGVLVGTLINGSLTFRNKMVRFGLMFGVASFVSITSSHSVYREDVLPLLGGPIALSIFCLSLMRIDSNWNIRALKNINWNALAVQVARFVLAAVYMHHTADELMSMTKESIGMDTLAAVVKASIMACVGVAATGTFQNEIDLNERLEVLVRNRTKEIQEKNDRLHMVELALRASETAIAITDCNLNVIWLNAACEDITSTKGREEKRQQQQQHYYSSQLLGRSIMEVFALETIQDKKKLTHAFSKSQREAEICIRDIIYRLEVSPYEYSSPTAVNNSSKNCGRFLVVLKNITADRAREVAEKSAREEAMLAQAMGDSMVTLTHELRTPMQGIMGVTSMLLQQSKPKDQADNFLFDSLKLIMASSGLLLNLINNLLDVRKVDSEMMEEFPLSPVVARSAIQDTITFCQPLASISGVAVVTDYGEDKNHDFQVVSNDLRLQQVLINLFSNAIKYTSEESKIHISIQPSVMSDVELKIQQALTSSRDTFVANTNSPIKKALPSNTPVLCFSISDCGPGIAPHQADRLFRRFARLDKQPTRALGGDNKIGQPSGTGLGLNLCQLFVQRMNGEIWATNNSSGIGSTFSFYLPLAAQSIVDSPIATPRTMAKRRLSVENLAMSTSLMRVLLVDDTLINRKVIGRMVKLVGVSDIVTVDSGQNALRELSVNGPYDLVITDLQMPGMSGSELCDAIMSDKSSPDIRQPIVVGLTADTSVSVAKICKASGMSTVLYKPISVLEMREFFDSTIMRLQPGVWYGGRESGTFLSAQ